MAGDLLALLDRLRIGKAVFAGGDVGGILIQKLAFAHPERFLGLVTFNTPILGTMMLSSITTKSNRGSRSTRSTISGISLATLTTSITLCVPSQIQITGLRSKSISKIRQQKACSISSGRTFPHHRMVRTWTHQRCPPSSSGECKSHILVKNARWILQMVR